MFFYIPLIRGIILKLENIIFGWCYRKKLGNTCRIYGFPIIAIHEHSNISIGKNVTLISHTYFSEPGINHPTIIRTLKSYAEIKIGDNVGISGATICAAESILIGNDVMIGANAAIFDTDFHSLAIENRRTRRDKIITKKVIIEDNVFIGMNSMILKGVHIGKNSIIGAGSIVLTDVEPNSVFAGNPASFIKKL
jgi:acetyltransferase-like isoleucine patch superfamily enzyme